MVCLITTTTTTTTIIIIGVSGSHKPTARADTGRSSDNMPASVATTQDAQPDSLRIL